MRARVLFIEFMLLLWCVTAGFAAVFEVGPGKACTSIGEVPWETLQPGDTVLIHYRGTPYHEKFVICRQGTAENPIIVRGVPGPNGELPVLNGDGATTRSQLSFWGENRAVIKIGGASKPSDTMPRFILIENLEVRSARPPYSFTGANGSTQNYVKNAAPVWIEKGENITIRNCTLHDGGNGLFVSSSDSIISRNILVEGCHIHSNGNTNSLYEHNVYTAALGITFQYNRLGPLREGCPGNNLKDRSAGLVIRYNWIEGGNRQLDLVDAEDSPVLRNDARYRSTHVYGNVLLESFADGNKQIVHYGGDSGAEADYRKGTLYFYNNTVVSKRPDQTTLFRLSTNDEHADVRNNILYVTQNGNSLSLADQHGRFTLSHNWLKKNWRLSFSTFGGSLTNDTTNIEFLTVPGFVDAPNNDFRLLRDSACVDAGGILPAVLLPDNAVERQYIRHQKSEPRPDSGPIDIGAFEFISRLESWRKEVFGGDADTASISGNDADPDGDGIPNLLEYAHMLDPLTVSAIGLPKMKLSNDEGSPVLLFIKRPAPNGLIYQVQTSSNLVHWINGCRYTDSGDLLDAGETTDISAPEATNRVIRINVPPTNALQRFVRVLVSEG